VSWFAVFDGDTGRLHSVSSTDPTPVPPPFQVQERPGKPNLRKEQWSSAGRNWVSKPARIWVDRIDDVSNDVRIADLMSDTMLVGVTGKLSAGDVVKIGIVVAERIRLVLREILGTSHRWRPSSHPTNIDAEPPSDTSRGS